MGHQNQPVLWEVVVLGGAVAPPAGGSAALQECVKKIKTHEIKWKHESL